ncbi:hypothetical protein GB937_010451 [Aspergillus fischeri]|nr:hypothetical protein GB937_010451 [Aspergillus fischeri]
MVPGFAHRHPGFPQSVIGRFLCRLGAEDLLLGCCDGRVFMVSAEQTATLGVSARVATRGTARGVAGM